ncbi:hypothetical protein JKP88DRAFT_185973, partial [Tribonema minus]
MPDDGAAIIDRMLGAIVYQRSFRVAFTGTSVTAGHDNLESQSYPMQFESIMAPIFEHSGVNFTATNSAMGNNDIVPYLWCLEAHVGIDPDI